MRRLEGITFNDIETLKKRVLFVWNRIPKSFCEKIINKFDKDIISLAKNGKIIKKSKSSYGPYKLSKPKYSDEIENIIYNKKIMEKNLEIKKKLLSKIINKKAKVLRHLKTKKFEKFVLEKISKRRIAKHLISNILNEELDAYQKNIDSLKTKKNELNNSSLDNFFEKLNKNEKESMINIYPNIKIEEDGDDEETEIDSMSDEIQKDIDARIKRIKEPIRKEIKSLILKKIESMEKRKRKKKNLAEIP